MPTDKATWDELLDVEKEIGLELYRTGVIKHLWTITAKYEAVVIYEVETPDELHRIIRNLPLWPYLDYTVESLVPHYYDQMLSERGQARPGSEDR